MSTQTNNAEETHREWGDFDYSNSHYIIHIILACFLMLIAQFGKDLLHKAGNVTLYFTEVM